MSSAIVERQETSSRMPRQKFEGHTKDVWGAIHLPGGQRIMTCSRDGSLRVWDLKSGKQIGDDWRDGDGPVYTIALSPDGKRVVSGSEDGGVRLWDMDTGKVIVTWMGHTKRVRTVCWSGDSQRALSGSEDGTARQWDVEGGEANLAPIKTGHEYVLAVVYSPDMSMFATSGLGQRHAKIWDVKTGKLVATFETADVLWCLAWTPDGKTLISGSYDSSIRTWSTTTWKQIAVLHGHTSAVTSIAISPNGRILASVSHDSTTRLWNLDNNLPIGPPLRVQDPDWHYVRSVSFSGDGKLLATGCFDHNAYIWDISGILKEAGLSELLLDKLVLAADATTSCPVRQPIIVPQRQVPHGSNSNTTQHCNGTSQAQSSQAPAAATASPVVTNTTPNTNPHIIIRHAGRWTRFWLFICCASAEYTHDHQ